MKMKLMMAVPCGLLLAAMPLVASAAEPALPGYAADLSQTTVSGISSGGFMAAQLATAYSSLFTGVGVIAGGPYDCASTYPDQSPLQNAVTACMSPLVAAAGADAAVSWGSAQRRAQEGTIDPVANLARQRVYAFSGASDRTVRTMVVDQVEKYYRLAGTPHDAIRYRRNEAGHAIITARQEDVACAETRAPYINNCGFSQSAELLAHLYGARSQPASTAALMGSIVRFNQHEFVKGSRASMDDTGYAYVPRDCQANACVVHVAFHGCQQGAALLGERFYMGTGYNEYADANRMIVLYPQVRPSNGIPPNPKGCWDFWGYSSEDQRRPDFQTRSAPQMAAVVAMLRRLGQPRATASASAPAP
jgi:poly(3-hydroxybutyrate) depolymerase